MAGVKYTKEQQQVIDLRNRNLLVSAAAGSGKTAVLVERIISIVSDEANPVDVDKLLVVTFTNAAAAEMRHRVFNSLEKKIREDSTSMFLNKQLVLLNNGNIKTIHGFCLDVMKTHYNQIDLDPSFRIGDTTEIELMKHQVVSDLLEDKYLEKEESFIHFVESYANGKTDNGIEDVILDVYHFSMSNIWPEKWLKDCVESLNISEDSFEKSFYFQYILKDLKNRFEYLCQQLNIGMRLCLEDQGPEHLTENIISYLTSIEEILDSEGLGFKELRESLFSINHPRISGKRKGYDPDLLQKVKGLLKQSKEMIKEVTDTYFSKELENIISDNKYALLSLEELVRLVIEFRERYTLLKKDKGIIDFNDIEHYALNILIDKEGNPTPVADDYMNFFEEVLIDEYQDSNIVQETILKSVSKERKNQPNIFMVGDVKQSIYKFRLAKPELFMEKYNDYSVEESKFQLINLHKNFRSRKVVLDSINYVFNRVMSKELGDVDYNEEVALNPGASYEETDFDYLSEILLVNDGKEEEEVNGGMSSVELESIVIGNKIKEIIQSKMTIYDKKIDSYREVKYKDIVILFRSAAGAVDTFVENFHKMGIPVYANSTVGYFDTVEVKVLINILKLINNERQDIPLVSVLRSSIVGLTEDDLLRIRKSFENGEFYMAIEVFLEGTIHEDALYHQLKHFFDQLKEWRRLSKYVPMDELLYKIFEDTNYYQYISLLPNGLQRRANLDVFVERAISYERTSFRGVFNFIQYIENMKKYQMDLGEASISTENDDLVKLMTIHKSKGLEFPVVFVANIGKRFNLMDMNKRIVYHQDIGIGADYVNYNDRYVSKTLPKIIVNSKNKEELLSEEMRILYVALTRAREKLILCGLVKDYEKRIEDVKLGNLTERVDKYQLKKSLSYLDWFINGILCDEQYRQHFHLEIIEKENIGIGDESLERNQLSSNAILDMVRDKDETHEKIKEALEFKYPLEYVNNYTLTMSVSDIKRASQVEDEAVYEKLAYKPKFMSEKKPLTGAEKGTIIHKIMYHVNDEIPKNQQGVNVFLEDLVYKKVITEEEKNGIFKRDILRFLKSDLFSRMYAKGSRLKKEVPFVIGMDLESVGKDVLEGTDEMVMVQGVIDAYFEEEGQIVLVDYKTDYIPDGDMDILASRYKEQMRIYKEALVRVTEKNVKEVVLYSVGKGITIIIKPRINS